MQAVDPNSKFDPRKFNFLISVCGIFGSLYFSEILKYPPCVLCWYQRIALYPLALIYAIALWTEDKSYKKYVLSFMTVGSVVALYHNLIYYNVITQAIVPCSEGASCKAKQLEVFGFITIPLLSLVAFSGMGFIEIFASRINQKLGR